VSGERPAHLSAARSSHRNLASGRAARDGRRREHDTGAPECGRPAAHGPAMFCRLAQNAARAGMGQQLSGRAAYVAPTVRAPPRRTDDGNERSSCRTCRPASAVLIDPGSGSRGHSDHRATRAHRPTGRPLRSRPIRPQRCLRGPNPPQSSSAVGINSPPRDRSASFRHHVSVGRRDREMQRSCHSHLRSLPDPPQQ